MTTEEQITSYCEKKEEEKLLSKSIKQLGETIKGFLIDNKKNDMQAGEWQINLQHKVTESIDEDKLLSVLKGFWVEKNGSIQCPFVSTVEVVNMEALEGAIYRGEIPDEILLKIDGCRIKKETDALTYKRAKKGDK